MDKILNGTWAVFDVLYDDNDISGRKTGARFGRTVSLVIDIDKNIMMLPTLKGNQKARFKLSTNSQIRWMEIYNADDDRFNGLYSIDITEIATWGKGSRKYGLTLESDHLLIYGEKTIVAL